MTENPQQCEGRISLSAGATSPRVTDHEGVSLALNLKVVVLFFSPESNGTNENIQIRTG